MARLFFIVLVAPITFFACSDSDYSDLQSNINNDLSLAGILSRNPALDAMIGKPGLLFVSKTDRGLNLNGAQAMLGLKNTDMILKCPGGSWTAEQLLQESHYEEGVGWISGYYPPDQTQSPSIANRDAQTDSTTLVTESCTLEFSGFSLARTHYNCLIASDSADDFGSKQVNCTDSGLDLYYNGVAESLTAYQFAERLGLDNDRIEYLADLGPAKIAFIINLRSDL